MVQTLTNKTHALIDLSAHATVTTVTDVTTVIVVECLLAHAFYLVGSGQPDYTLEGSVIQKPISTIGGYSTTNDAITLNKAFSEIHTNFLTIIAH